MFAQLNSIFDTAGIDRQNDVMFLTIREERPWSMDHLFQLQEKINGCLAFIQSGQVFAVYPESARHDMLIKVASKYRPSSEAADFLEQATQIIEDAGIQFRYGPLTASYIDD